MQIFIEAELKNGKIPEWGLLEFQGSFSKNENDKVPMEEYVGDLNYTKDVILETDIGIPFFLNGHHIIYGEEVKLQKPLAVIRKNSDEDSCEKEYLVIAVIRRKVIFKTRPKPIIPNEVSINNI